MAFMRRVMYLGTSVAGAAMRRVLATLLPVLLGWFATAASPALAQPVALAATIALPGVEGRLDHLALDFDGRRVFVAALGADRVEIIDLAGAKRIGSLRGLKEPQGLAYLAHERRLLVANGKGGSVDAFDGDRRTAHIVDLEDADNLRVDPATGQVYVGYSNGLAALDPTTLQTVRRIPLRAHAEGFELSSTGPEIYVNLPGAAQVAVVDRRSGKTLVEWTLGAAKGNFAMALDEASHRLLVATRQPAMLLVFDTSTGRRTAEVPLCGDADDLFVDHEHERVLAICGEGVVEVLRQLDADHYEVRQRVATSPGARTGLFVPALHILVVAAPSRHGRAAEVQIFDAR